MKSKRNWLVALAAVLVLCVTLQYYWSNFWLYGSIGAPAMASDQPQIGCTVENPVSVDIRAEATRIEELAAVVAPNWGIVQSDPQVHASAVELADTLDRLSRSNLVVCSQYSQHGFYSSLAFVARQIRRDQGLGIVSRFPEIHILGNRFNGEPELIEFWHKKGATIEVGWSRSFDSSDRLSGWINMQATPDVIGSHQK